MFPVTPSCNSFGNLIDESAVDRRDSYIQPHVIDGPVSNSH